MALQNPFVISATRGLDQRQQPTTDGAQGFAVEADNLAFSHAAAMVMRLGLASQDLTSAGVTGSVEWVGKHITNAGVEELWIASNNAGTANLARRSGGTWSTVTFSDTVNVANLRYMCGASLNGMFALMYDSNVNRAHVWDGTNLRRMGISKPSAPTVANTGAGAYAADARRYRVQFLIVSGSDTVAASELSDATNTFTPSGTGTAARVTKPTTPDSATHWRVYAIAGSTDTYDSYELISGNIAVGTTTYDDSTAPASYDGENPAALGTYIPPPSAKYVVSDGLRFLMAGAWESSGSAGETDPKHNRVWFTPPLGASDIGDSERIPNIADVQFNKHDCGDAGPLTSISEPLEGRIYVLKDNSVGILAPTGVLESPYTYRLLTKSAGCVDQRSLVLAENGEGVPSLYFASKTSVYQITGGSIRDISEAFRRDIRLARFSAADSLVGWDPVEKTLFVQLKISTGDRAGQYRHFLYDVASERVSGAHFGTYQAGWVLGSSVLGVNTKLTAQGIVRHAVTALDEDGAPRLILVGQTSDGAATAGAVFAYGAQIGADGATGYTARLRVRVPLGLAAGRMISVGNPTVIYRNPVGSENVTGTLTVSYVREDGEVSSQAKTLETTDIDDALGQRTMTFEQVTLGDVLNLDVRLQLTYDGSVDDTTVPPAVDVVMVPWKLQNRVAE
jgi:hypothetical protein